MHNLPGAVIRTKDARSPKSHGGDLLFFCNFDLEPLYHHNVGKLGSHVRRHILEASYLAISVQGCGTLHGRSDLLPSTCGRGNGVSEGEVFSMGEHLLHGSGVPFHELTQRELHLLNYSVKIVYSSH